MMAFLSRYAIYPVIVLFGAFFSWRLLSIPSRVETAAFMISFFLIPTLKYPKFGVYYLFCVPFFIPLFRRMYYLVEDRPELDYLMLISDGVMGGFICALALLWLLNKERARDPFPILIVVYTVLLFIKVFLGNEYPPVIGLYGFKFHGLYVMFFFSGAYVLTSTAQVRSLVGFVSCILLFTAVYGIKQILFGFTGFEQKWLDSITFTTLYIEGVVRPFSTYLSPATLSDGMTILIITGLYWVVSKGRHMALFGLLLVASAIWPILIATVRTNWLASLAGIFFYLVFLRIRRGWVKGLLMAFLLLGVVGSAMKGGGGASQAQSAAIQGQLTSRDRSLSDIMIKNRTQALANPLQEYSLQKRLQTWGLIWMMVLRKPFGNGQGSAGYAHSFYFQVLGEIGFPGIILFLCLLYMAFSRGFKVIKESRDEMAVELTRYLLTVVFVISLLNLTGTHLHTPPGDLFFWFALGSIHRFYREMMDAQKQDQLNAQAAAYENESGRPSDPLTPAGAPA